MHDNLSYAVSINLSEKAYDVEPLKNRASKIVKEKKQSKETQVLLKKKFIKTMQIKNSIY